jgi:hypothetical protein
LLTCVKTRPWWARRDDEALPCPLWTSDLLGCRRGRLAVICTLLLVVLVGATRAAVVPASVWDRDEAHLGLAVARFDPAADRPHAPWFPLWVMCGKLTAPVVSEPARGLQLTSALLGTWTLFPLTALLSIWLCRRLATAGSLLYLFAPAPWFLSGRAYSDTPGAFLLLLAAAWWLRSDPRDREVMAGSVAAALCLMARPQLVLPIAGMGIWCWLRVRNRRARFLLVAPLALAATVAVAGLVLVTGSAAQLLGSLTRHLRYHLEGLAAVDHSLAACSVSRALIRPELAAAWILLAAVGVVAWHWHRRAVGSPWPLLLGGLAPLLLTVLLLSDPTQTRYALPVLALSAGPVVIGLASLVGRGSLAIVAVAVATSLALGVPQAVAVRLQPSPVMSALMNAGVEATERRGVVVVDRTLRVFADYATEVGWLTAPVLNDFSLEIGAVETPPAPRTVAVFDRGRGSFVASADRTELVRCQLPWVRRLGPDRFLDVTVASGARLVRTPTRW